MRNTPSVFISMTALIASLGLGWLSVHYSLPILIIGVALLGTLVITRTKELWLILFTLGVHFDDLYINFGFSKAGYGDFALMILIAYWALWRSNHFSPLQLPSKWPLVIVYVIGVGLSWQQGPTPQAVTGLFIRNTLYVIGYFALVDLLRSPKQLAIFLGTTLFATFVHVIIALFILERSTRLEGLSEQPNIFGGLIGPGALIAVICSASPLLKKTWRALLAFGGILIIVGLTLTVSRGSQIAFISAILWTYRKRWRGILLASLLIGVIIQLFLFLDPSRLDYLFSRWRFEEGSISGRREIIFNAINIIIERPFFGVGFAQFMQLDTVLNLDAGHGRSSHNHYLGELATIGIPAALSIFSFILYQARSLLILTSIGDARARLHITILQALFVFQSVALIFRGGRRMIEWSFLAVYTAAVIIYHERARTLSDQIKT